MRRWRSPGGHAAWSMPSCAARCANRPALEAAVSAAGPEIARHSHPGFLITRWEKEFGREATAQLCAWNNQPAEVYVRANTLKVTARPRTAALFATTRPPSKPHPQVLKVRQLPFSWIASGLCYVPGSKSTRSRRAISSIRSRSEEPSSIPAPRPAAKATPYLAQRMRNTGRLMACDLYESRVDRLRENLRRLGAHEYAGAAARLHAGRAAARTAKLRPHSRGRSVQQYGRPPPARRCPLAAH